MNMTTWSIDTQLNTKPEVLPPSKDLGFGRYFAGHMFSASFKRSRGWYGARITPYEPLMLDPAAGALHYGQALFEGLKAFRRKDGSLAVFRPEFNWKRMAQGAERLVMEPPPLDLWMQGLMQLLRVSEKAVPSEKGTSLYIRPTLIATEGFLGVRPSDEYLFFIILSPVGSYYSTGSGPVKIWVEKEYLRAAPGGLGATKAAANYAGSLRGALQAKKKNYSQVLWLDVTKTYVQEVGTMNVFFVLGDEIVTPSLEDGTILEGGTRQVAIQLLKEKGHKVSERKISLQELLDAHKSQKLTEAFGTGTAAVISPIGELSSEDFSMKLQGNGPVATALYNEISAIHYGEKPDTHAWMVTVP
jgi:branched-chain amino acid aminotransferase